MSRCCRQLVCVGSDDDEGGKKRRSRWEKEEKPDAGAIMVSPMGVPQAVVLAGGIKVGSHVLTV